jgi:hypothetical protein
VAAAAGAACSSSSSSSRSRLNAWAGTPNALNEAHEQTIGRLEDYETYQAKAEVFAGGQKHWEQTFREEHWRWGNRRTKTGPS